ncbi:MAG: hypothetical protein ACRCZI_07065 [Cetobacterium sp.]
MLSALANPGMPPLMAAESQSPGLMGLAKANFQETMADPKRAKVAQAMMGQAMGGLSKMFAPAQIPDRPRQTDMYGNPIG